MYESAHAPKEEWTAIGEESRRINWSRLELGIECKVKANLDPFDEWQDSNEPVAEGRKNVWAQLLDYADLVFKFQQRVCHYTIIFFGHYARVIRFDRSGVVASDKINYATDGSRLTEFLVRYCRLGRKNRGHDETATRIEPTDELFEQMKAYADTAASGSQDYVADLFEKTLDETWPWWKLEVEDEVSNSCKTFAVGKPHFLSGGVVGRGTRGYVAVPLDEKDNPKGAFVYLKDAWRVNHPGMEKEGTILSVLNEAKVQYIPTLLCHGDISGQDTLSYNLWAQYHPDEDLNECPLKSHQHYRIVEVEVGKPLSEFANGMELVWAILCCVIGECSFSRSFRYPILISPLAHKEACQAGYIHRDISAGNILLYKDADGDWVGLLNDWELSKAYTDGKTEEGSRQVDRTVLVLAGIGFDIHVLIFGHTGNVAVHVGSRPRQACEGHHDSRRPRIILPRHALLRYPLSTP